MSQATAAAPPPPPAARPRPARAPKPSQGPVGDGESTGYKPSTGTGAQKGARRDHPAFRYGDVGDPGGHLRYAAGIIADAKAGRGGVTEQTAAFAAAVKKAPSDELSWPLKRMVIMKMKWADRRVAGAYEALARAAARKAKARQDADAAVIAARSKRKKTRAAGAYTAGQ